MLVSDTGVLLLTMHGKRIELVNFKRTLQVILTVVITLGIVCNTTGC
jgi:hypothetical protein